MTDWLSLITWGQILVLVSLELGLALQNLLCLTGSTSELKPRIRHILLAAGFTMAGVLRLAVLHALQWVEQLQQPIIHWDGGGLSWSRALLIIGGGWLVLRGLQTLTLSPRTRTFSATRMAFGLMLLQITWFNLYFSIEAVVVANALTNSFAVMSLSVLVSILAMWWLMRPLERFLAKNTGMQTIAQCFVLLLGVSLFLEGCGVEQTRTWIFPALGFAVLVEFLNIRRRRRDALRKALEDL